MFERVHLRYKIPLNALCISAIMTGLVGCNFFDFDDSLLCHQLCVEGDFSHLLLSTDPDPLCTGTKRALAPALGWVLNGFGVTYAALTSVLFLFASMLPVTRKTMNYGGVVLVLVRLISIILWMSGGKKSYLGPAMLRYDKVSVESSLIGDDEESTPIFESRNSN